MSDQTKTAVFGGGCFWCTEAVFARLKGVRSVEPGYSGGNVDNPNYEVVSTGRSGHAEVIKVEYDPEVISYDDLLTVFFFEHDPTTLNRQGEDVGTQYRSVILYSDEEQKARAEKFVFSLKESGAYDQPIVTEILPLEKFHKAEMYHKDYYDKNREVAYCELVITPKVEKLEKRFAELIK
ncbi:MAG: peptide-methionine (S)-S-oxide reductase MsrA [Candidatus Taylorbacteria bacterium]|nr:peptide-methionine (S)-S-oxide reductase MsrA [Candidatus Taylorbacteria bacterium]